MVDIGVSWLSSLKEGVCRDQFWLNQEQCCWSYNMTVFSPLYGLNSSSAASDAISPKVVGLLVNSSLNEPDNLTSVSSNTTTIMHPHIAGSGAQSAFGFYSCEQVRLSNHLLNLTFIG